MSITNGAIWTSPSSQDPSGQGGFTGAGNIWAQNDTGNWYVRNMANTAWTLLGSGDQQSFGLMPLSGGAMSGALTGSTGLMTADGSTPFAVPPTVTSKSSVIASMADLTALQNNIVTLINQTVAQSLSSLPSFGIRSNMAFSYGTVTSTQVTSTPVILNLPYSGMTYPDGTAVALADCFGFASIQNVMTGTSASAYQTALIPQGTTTNNFYNGMQWVCFNFISPSTYSGGTLNYLIIAIKPNA